MTFKDLAQKMCSIEGKKHQINIADMREILSVLSILMYNDSEVIEVMLKLGKKKKTPKSK